MNKNSDESYHRCANTRLRVLIVEDDYEFQRAIVEAVEQVSETANIFSFFRGLEAISFLENMRQPLDIVLVDLGLPDIDGKVVIETVNRLHRETPILVLTTLLSKRKAAEAFQAGATGYVLKDDEVYELETAIKIALQGDTPVSAKLTKEILATHLSTQNKRNVEVQLSDRESELLFHIAKGLSYKKASTEMQLSLATIHSYSRNLFRKIGVNSKTQAIVWARHNGFV